MTGLSSFATRQGHRIRRRLEEGRQARGRVYRSVELDDPSFPAPIYASLADAEDGREPALIWSRRTAD